MKTLVECTKHVTGFTSLTQKTVFAYLRTTLYYDCVHEKDLLITIRLLEFGILDEVKVTITDVPVRTAYEFVHRVNGDLKFQLPVHDILMNNQRMLLTIGLVMINNPFGASSFLKKVSGFDVQDSN